MSPQNRKTVASAARADRRVPFAPALIAAAFAASTLAGCLSSDGDKAFVPGDGAFSVEKGRQVVAITQPAGAAPGRISTREISYSCEGSQVVSDTVADTLSYALAQDHLYLWYAGSCMSRKLAGTSSTLFGSWTTQRYYEDSIPAAYRDSCGPGDFEPEPFGTDFSDMRITYEVSATEMNALMSGKICLASVAARNLYGGNAYYDSISTDCAQATIRKASNGRLLLMSTSWKNEVVTVSFTSKGKTCSIALPMDLSNQAPTCPEIDYDANENEAANCLVGLGFYDGVSKQSAKGRFSSLKKDLEDLRRSVRAAQGR